MFPLQNARQLATFAARSLVRPGDTVVDATMGNGYDTLLLAQAVGESGHVYAMDIQAQAVGNTHGLLAAAGLLSRVSLLQHSHAEMARLVPGPVRLVMFNLGWLPGGDKGVTTHTASTICAVHAAMALVSPGGVVLVTVYPGHDMGRDELTELISTFEKMQPAEWSILSARFVNYGPDAPQALWFQRNR